MVNFFYFLFFFTFVLTYTNFANGDSIVWNVERNTDVSFHTMLSQSSQEPVIIFNHPNFLLSSFSKEAGAYGFKNDGGKLKNLKKWIDQSKGYVVTNDIISSQLLQYFDKTNYEPENPPAAEDVAVLLVDVSDWQDLNSKVEEIRKIFKGKSFVAVLTTVGQYRNKRDVTMPPEEPQTSYQNFTFINEDSCMLYAEGIYFLVKYKKTTDGGATYTTCKVTLDKNPTQYEATCGNYSGQIVLSYNMANPGQNFDHINCSLFNGTLSSLQVVLSFFLHNFTDWWYVSDIYLDAYGSMIQGPDNNRFVGKVFDRLNSTEQFSYIQAYKSFAYACSEPDPVYSGDSYSVPGDKVEYTFFYGLGFKNIQVQPFNASHLVSGSMFTDNVDDCTPFFSIYIWMLLISVFLLFGIVACGMGMMSSLKTMDRFDDSRAKTITVNVVN